MDPHSLDLDSVAPSQGTVPPRARFTSSLPAVSLNGTWRFHWSASVAAAPVGVERPDFDDCGWDEWPVPSSWPLPGRGRTGYGAPAYTNVQFPFPVDPPHPPDENPVGDHRLTFTVGAELLQGARLRFDGVDNAGEVWLNGISLGSTRGSRLAQEFDVTGVLAETNVLCVRVAQWSAHSYLEDQDMWWLPGIFRDVTLLAHPPGAIEDLEVHASWADGHGRLRLEITGSDSAEVALPELGVAGRTGEIIDVGPVVGWSAEIPRLYELVVRTELETVTERVGFRTVSFDDGVLAVNGQPILLRGVNRHEHDPDLGRVVPAEMLQAELYLMKQHNINAIRTSHYPPHPDLLALADELGFWVIDECDLETHGFLWAGWRRNPSGEPEWREAYLDRMRRTVERDKNRPCVIGWSLGNESGVGANLAAMAEWVQRRDPSRFRHYEGDWASPYVDVYSRMYAPPAEVALIGTRSEPPLPDPALDAHRRALSFLLCEYAHAMGNGPGGMSEYQELFEAHDRLAGGFVWEWAEHGIRAWHDEPGREGQEFFAYGGDFGEVVHDGNFVCDGLVSPDRMPRPGLVDYKTVVQPLRMEVDDQWRTVRVRSRFDHTDGSPLGLQWRIDGPAGLLASGPVGPLSCPPGGEVTLELPTEVRAQRPAGAAMLTVSAVLAADLPWAPVGHEVAWCQAGTTDSGSPGEPAVPAATVVAPVPGPTAYVVGPGRFDVGTGRLVELAGRALVGPELALWRAPTDNDLGRAFTDGGCDADDWAAQGLNRLRTRLVACDAEGDALIVRQRVGVATVDRFLDLTWRWTSDGSALALDLTLALAEAGGEWGSTWARIGLDLVLDGGWSRVEWSGYGPGQRYPDTGQGQRLGWWRSDVAGLQVPYARPQENGSRRVTGTLVLGDPMAGTSLAIGAEQPFNFAARPWSVAMLASARHTHDLVPDGRLHLSLDHRQHGIGTAACGPGVLPAYRLNPNELSVADRTFRLTFGPG